MANDLSAFSDKLGPKKARAKAKDKPEEKAEPITGDGEGMHLPSPDPAPDHVPGLTPHPQPGEVADERPGKEVSADAHDEDVAPIIGFVDHVILGVDGSRIAVHTPGVVLVKKPTA
jgi:hypothetical protein